MNNNYQKFSVLLSVYHKDNPLYLSESLKSVSDQTMPPTEIVVVKDGKLTPELDKTVALFIDKHPDLFKLVNLPANQGLGPALNSGLRVVTNEFVARMDADDIAAPDRFEKQLRFLQKNTEYDIVGSYILEFISSPNEPLHIRNVPETHNKIFASSRKQNPMNHMTVVFKKSSVLEAGGYRNVPFFEDYDLWIRMLSKEMKFYNIPEILVYARVGNNMIGKRSGLDYCRHEINFFTEVLKMGFITKFEFLQNLMVRLPLRLLPNFVLSILYNQILRKPNV